MSDKSIIETKLSNASNSLVEVRPREFETVKRGDAVTLDRLPDELVWFIHHYERVELFYQGILCPYNGWRIGRLSWWPDITVNQERNAVPGDYPYFEDVWQLASYAYDGGEQVAIDLHPGPRFGYIGWVTQTDIDYGGGAIVVAKSFFEWLERTLDHGPHAERPYWREIGFKDYGPLIPDDPYYKPA